MNPKYLTACLLLAAPVVFAASFDCSKASNAVERFICDEPYLGRLDEALAVNYRNLRDIFGNRINQKIKYSQIDWLKDRNKCTTERCLVSMYKVRINEMCDVISSTGGDCIHSEDVRQ